MKHVCLKQTIFILFLILAIVRSFETTQISYFNSGTGLAKASGKSDYDGKWTNIENWGCDSILPVYAIVFSQMHSQTLRFSNFGIDIPDDAEVLGLKVSFDVSVDKDSPVFFMETEVGLFDSKKNYMTKSRIYNHQQGWPTQRTTIEYPIEGEDEMWGSFWKSSQLKSQDFGVFIRGVNGPTNVMAKIHCVKIQVKYSTKTQSVSTRPNSDPKVTNEGTTENETSEDRRDTDQRQTLSFDFSVGAFSVSVSMCIFVVLFAAWTYKKKLKKAIVNGYQSFYDKTDILEGVTINTDTHIGIGSFGKVYKASYEGNEIAVKVDKNFSFNEIVMQSKFIYQNLSGQLSNEYRILKTLKHKNIVKFLGQCNFSSQGRVVWAIALELSKQGSLGPNKNNFFRLGDMYNFSRDLLKAVIYLHSQRILHRDIAARNLLLFDNTVKLCDFGLSVRLPAEMDYVKETRARAIRWTSPESLIDKIDSFKSDTWACGVTIWEIFSGDLPWNGETEDSVEDMIRSKDPNELYLKQGSIHDDIYKDLIEKMMKIEPEERIDLKDAKEFMNRLIDKNVVTKPRNPHSNSVLIPTRAALQNQSTSLESFENDDTDIIIYNV